MPWEIGLIHAVLGVLQRADKILIAERPINKPYSGYWEFPGGKIETDELSDAALYRELNEELGITVLSAQHWFDHCHHYPNQTVFMEIWRVHAFSGEPFGKENQKIAWLTLKEISNVHLLPGNLPILEKISLTV